MSHLRRSGRAVLLALFTFGLWAVVSADTNPTPPPKSKRPGSKGGDFEMVERLLAARREYQQGLEALRTHYISTGDIERARWAEDELIQWHRIAKHPFRLELDVPPPTLQGNNNIPEANDLYRRALVFKEKGWGSTYLDNQHRAELLFQQLLTNYPQSDKISDAAYQLGDIYESKVFRQYDRSAAYFERCFQWNPKTQFDARIRAARLYDHSLNERNRAIEIYKEITNRETDPKRMEEAQRRLTELGAKK
jgi:hypothetical protein